MVTSEDLLKSLLQGQTCSNLGHDWRRCSADESFLARSDIADISVVAHGLCMQSFAQSKAIVEALWQGTSGRLKTTKPHLVLMLLNAFVRQGL
eukprot:6481540-Amphidinium_carterae.1